jgi:glucosylceramidase
VGFALVASERVETTGICDDAVGFVNPDGTVVMMLRNAAQHEQFVDIRAGGRMATVKLLPDSISTVTMKA